MRALLRQARLPVPRVNARAAGYEIDFLWEPERVIVEVDGYAYHGNRRAFERDRRKDLALTSAGYLVIRISWRQLDEEPFVIVAHLARAFERAARTAG
jgi:very-short-patch-repair endonuclease